MGSDEAVAETREQCLRDYGRCAEACEAALDGLHAAGATLPRLRSDLIVCAAVCRVAIRSLEEAETIAETLVAYSVDVCRRCEEEAARSELADGAELADACGAAATCASALLGLLSLD